MHHKRASTQEQLNEEGLGDDAEDSIISPKRRRLDLAPSFASLSLHPDDQTHTHHGQKRVRDDEDVAMDIGAVDEDGDGDDDKTPKSTPNNLHKRPALGDESNTRPRPLSFSKTPKSNAVYVDSLEDDDDGVDDHQQLHILDPEFRRHVKEIGKPKDTFHPIAGSSNTHLPLPKQPSPPPPPKSPERGLVLYRSLPIPSSAAQASTNKEDAVKPKIEAEDDEMSIDA